MVCESVCWSRGCIVAKRLDRSRCRLACGVGLATVTSQCIRWGSGFTHGKGQFWGISSPLKSIGIACSRVFSDMYHWTVNDAQLLWRASHHARRRFTKGHGYLGRRCGLLSNYFDFLFFLIWNSAHCYIFMNDTQESCGNMRPYWTSDR